MGAWTRAMPYAALVIFAVAFGVEEAIIVVYLRHLNVFAAPAYALETWREFCTLIVIGAAAWLSGTSAAERVKAFCFAFGAWDVVYYLGLWQLSGIPRIVDTDVLFLIPVPWIAPVWAPMTFAVLLMVIGVMGVIRTRMALLAAGFILALLSFVYQTAFKSAGYPVWLFLISVLLILSALPLHVPKMRIAARL